MKYIGTHIEEHGIEVVPGCVPGEITVKEATKTLYIVYEAEPMLTAKHCGPETHLVATPMYAVEETALLPEPPHGFVPHCTLPEYVYGTPLLHEPMTAEGLMAACEPLAHMVHHYILAHAPMPAAAPVLVAA